MKTYIIDISDLHVNSSVAICPPTVNLDDGGTYSASPGQRWIWRKWLEFIDMVKGLDGRKILLVNGDAGELDTKRRSIQLITPNKSTILRMAVDVLDPLLQLCDASLVLRGTPAHTGKSAWLEEALGRDIGAIPAGDEIFSHWHWRGTVENVPLDIAHHASMGRTPWAKYNSASNLAARMTWEYMVDMRQPPPALALRAHNHLFADSGTNYPVRVLYSGCWSLATEYSYRVGFENVLANIGGYIITCEDGQAQVNRVKFDPEKGRRIWANSI